MSSLSTFSSRQNEDQGCRFRRVTSGRMRVVMNLTSRCNLHCRHCFARQESAELDTGQWLTIIEQLPEIDACKLILTGGEPLLRPDLEILVRETVKLNIGVDVNSNLLPLTPRRATHLWDAGLREISTSLDGLEEYHDWFRRRPGTFDETLKRIRLAVAMGFDVDIHGVCTPGNVHQIGQVIDRCVKLGIASYTLLGVVSSGGETDGPSSRSFTLGLEDELRLQAILEHKRAEYGERFPIRTVDVFRHPGRTECNMADTVVGITPAGKLMPCLLAQYAPVCQDDLTQWRLEGALQAMQERLGDMGKQINCTNFR
jgi:MoaA/NifB/PqqE/SkfB family radical SAM enzyme